MSRARSAPRYSIMRSLMGVGHAFLESLGTCAASLLFLLRLRSLLAPSEDAGLKPGATQSQNQKQIPCFARNDKSGSASLCAGFVAVDIFVLDVALSVGVDGGLVDAGQGALHLARVAYDQATGGDFGSFQEERAGGDDAAGADVDAVQDDGAHANQAARLDGAAVERDGVADGDVVAEDQGVLVAHDVENAAVLNVGAGADADVVDVPPNHGAGPHAGVF